MSTYPRFDGSQSCVQVNEIQRRSFDGQGLPDVAKQLCLTCPFVDACGAYAIGHDVCGVWGGLSEQERRDQRQVHGLPDPTPVTLELDELVLAWRSAAESTVSTSCEQWLAGA